MSSKVRLETNGLFCILFHALKVPPVLVLPAQIHSIQMILLCMTYPFPVLSLMSSHGPLILLDVAKDDSANNVMMLHHMLAR